MEVIRRCWREGAMGWAGVWGGDGWLGGGGWDGRLMGCVGARLCSKSSERGVVANVEIGEIGFEEVSGDTWYVGGGVVRESDVGMV